LKILGGADHSAPAVTASAFPAKAVFGVLAEVEKSKAERLKSSQRSERDS
jgi:hypothetical protein